MPLRLKRYLKRSENWYIRGSVRGQAIFETTGTHDAATAEAIRIKREGQLLERSVFGAGATVSFLQAAVSYLDAGGEARFLGKVDEHTGRWSLLIGYFGAKTIARIGQAEADEAAAAICPSAGPATRKRQVYVPLCAVLNHAEQKGWGKAPKIKHPKVAPAVTKWSTPERLEKLLPHCKPPLRRLIMVMTYTGARLSEALRLNWDQDVDIGRRAIIFRRTKMGKMRTVHVPDPLLLELASVDEAKRHGRVFHWSDKSHVHQPLRRACRRAGVEYLPPHQQGRHTFATWLRLYAKRDLRGLMEDGGWDSIVSVARYAHVVPGESVRAIDSLPHVQNPCSSTVVPAKTRKRKAEMKP